MEITIQKTTNQKHINACNEAYGESYGGESYQFDFYVASFKGLEVPFVQEAFGGQFVLNSGEHDQVRTYSLLEILEHLKYAFCEIKPELSIELESIGKIDQVVLTPQQKRNAAKGLELLKLEKS
jgi:hypothetical protein